MQPIYHLANRLKPLGDARASPLPRLGHHSVVRGYQLEAIRMAFTWTVLTIAAFVVWYLIIAGYNIITGHRSTLVIILFLAPAWFCVCGVVLQSTRGIIASAMIRRLPRTISPTYVSPRPLRWLLTSHDSDLLFQLIVTILITALYTRAWL